jgi:hypothetical protein
MESLKLKKGFRWVGVTNSREQIIFKDFVVALLQSSDRAFTTNKIVSLFNSRIGGTWGLSMSKGAGRMLKKMSEEGKIILDQDGKNYAYFIPKPQNWSKPITQNKLFNDVVNIAPISRESVKSFAVLTPDNTLLFFDTINDAEQKAGALIAKGDVYVFKTITGYINRPQKIQF